MKSHLLVWGIWFGFEMFQLLTAGLRSVWQKLRNFLRGGLSSSHVETFMLQPEDEILFASDKF